MRTTKLNPNVFFLKQKNWKPIQLAQEGSLWGPTWILFGSEKTEVAKGDLQERRKGKLPQQMEEMPTKEVRLQGKNKINKNLRGKGPEEAV